MTLAEAISKRNRQPQASKNVNIILHMPEVASMVRHLDMLYTRILSSSEPQQQENNLVDILGKPYMQTRAWYNPGRL